MSRLLLKTRVTLGISFWPSWTSGLTFSFVLLLGGEERIPQVHALAAQHHGADGNALLLLVQIGDDELRHVGADAAGLVVARQQLESVVPGKHA